MSTTGAGTRRSPPCEAIVAGRPNGSSSTPTGYAALLTEDAAIVNFVGRRVAGRAKASGAGHAPGVGVVAGGRSHAP